MDRSRYNTRHGGKPSEITAVGPDAGQKIKADRSPEQSALW